MRPSAVTPVRALAAVAAMGLCACGDDGAAPSYLGPVAVADAASPERDAGSPADSGSPDALRATPCPPPPNLPPAEDPRDAVVAVAVTGSRLYVASARAIYAFRRDGACAGPLDEGFRGGALALDRRPEAIAAEDAIGVVVADATGAVLLTDDPAATGCLARTPLRSLGLAPSLTVGAFVEPRILRLGGRTGCDGESLSVPDATELLSVGAADGDSVVAVTRDARARTSVRRYRVGAGLVPEGEARSGPCSARAVVGTASGALVLDPACGAVRQYDLSSGDEVARLELPAGEVGRALARVPGEPRVVLATAPAAGGSVSLLHVRLAD